MTCTWEPDLGCIDEAEWLAFTEDVRERALMLATSSLQMLTNYRVGTCPITIRPCPENRRRCGCDWNPHIRNGVWVNDCLHRTRCEPLSQINIPGPVGYIESMLIDGVVVDLWNGDWRLDNGHLLVWQGEGTSPVPSTQDLDKPDTEAGTWSITYSRSAPVAKDARMAVAALAIEFARECGQSTKKCGLPKNVRNVTRLGVSFTIEAGLWPGGLTSIKIADAFILKWNPPGSPTRSATVFDPRRINQPRVVSSVPQRGSLGSV
jgi:hypothetical protein